MHIHRTLALLALMTLPLGAFQMRRNQGTGSTVRGSQVNTDAVASFTGKLKSADKKFVVLAVENSESLKMYVTGKTKFVRDGKAAKAADFHDGDPVTIDAERDLRLNMVAVRVEFPAKPISEAPK